MGVATEQGLLSLGLQFDTMLEAYSRNFDPKHPYSSPVFCLRIRATLSHLLHAALGHLAVTTPTAATFRRSLRRILTCFLRRHPTISRDGFPILLMASSRGSKGCLCSWPLVRMYCPATLFPLFFIILVFEATFLCSAPHSCSLARCGEPSPAHNIYVYSRHSPSQSFTSPSILQQQHLRVQVF